MRRLLLLLVLFCFQVNLFAEEVNIYSARKEMLIKPLLDQFTIKTGIKVNLVTGKADTLIKRLQSESRNTPADLLLTTDVARLYRASELQLLQQINSEILASTIPAQYRDDDNNWFGLSLRSRVLVYAPERVSKNELQDYLSLAEDKWHKRLCIRSSSNVYNQSLVAALIAHYGKEETERWAKSLVKNFARSPKGGDRDQIRAVASGQCDVAVVNNYYLAGMLDSKIDSDVKIASSVKLFWPDQNNHGAHVNVSGAGVTRYANHRAQAIQLLEYLVSDEAQQWYAAKNHEYPVKQGIDVSEILSQWGEFKRDDIELKQLGILNREAVLLMDRAGWK